MTMILMPEVNLSTYLHRMSNSNDKTDLLNWIPQSSSVLDFGCADGSIAPTFTKEQYTGYDLSEVMVEHGKLAHPGYRFISALAENETWDAIICSSVMHEVYSYSDYSYEEVVKVFLRAKAHLSSNGALYIRDGINPVQSGDIRSYELRDVDSAVNTLNMLREQTEQVFDVEIDNGMITGEFADIINFLNIYTWGEDSFPREKHERVNFASLEQWHEMLSTAGFTITRETLISQDDYFTHLDKIVDLRGDKWITKIYIEAKCF